ncbi:MAG: hypothetical protein JSR45_12495 [Proteobacteria bacterium]|nr:hypothetical protein [Pseudomonadota bacterium]
MSEDGYTLTETLAALLMIGLAIVGLTQAMSVIGRIQGRAGASLSQGQTLREARLGLSSVLKGAGPFRSDTEALQGDARSFTFDCGRPSRCGARIESTSGTVQRVVIDFGGRSRSLAVASADPLVFGYEVDGAVPLSAWPPEDEGQRRRSLKAVSLARRSAQGDTLVARARVWSEQPADCKFDLISQECRGGAS